MLVVTLSIYDDSKILKFMKQVFKETIYSYKYRSEITVQPKNNNLVFIIDLTVRNIYRLFVVSLFVVFFFRLISL